MSISTTHSPGSVSIQSLLTREVQHSPGAKVVYLSWVSIQSLLTREVQPEDDFKPQKQQNVERFNPVPLNEGSSTRSESPCAANTCVSIQSLLTREVQRLEETFNIKSKVVSIQSLLTREVQLERRQNQNHRLYRFNPVPLNEGSSTIGEGISIGNSEVSIQSLLTREVQPDASKSMKNGDNSEFQSSPS